MLRLLLANVDFESLEFSHCLEYLTFALRAEDAALTKELALKICTRQAYGMREQLQRILDRAWLEFNKPHMAEGILSLACSLYHLKELEDSSLTDLLETGKWILNYAKKMDCVPFAAVE